VKFISHLDDYTPGMKVVVVSAFEDVWTPMGERIRRERTDVKGHVFTFEVWNPPIMILEPLRSIESNGMPGSIHRMGPFAMLCAGEPDNRQKEPTAMIFDQDDIELAAVTEEWLDAYTKHFCDGKQQPKKVKDDKPSVRDLLKE